MKPRIRSHKLALLLRLRQFAGWGASLVLVAGLAVGLLAGSAPPVALAAETPMPPPDFTELREPDENGTVHIEWRMRARFRIRLDGYKQRFTPTAPWGIRFNVYLERTNELVRTVDMDQTQGRSPNFGSVNEDPRGRGFAPEELFPRGSIRETRYCITLQSHTGEGAISSRAFSEETRRRCIGTQKIQVITPVEDLTTKPDLKVTRVSGPLEVFDGATAVYEVVLANEGAPAKDTAQVQISVMGPLELVELTLIPSGFTCELGEFGFSCVGSLGGKDDPPVTHVAGFRVQVRGAITGASSEGVIVGSANHGRTLDEVTVDNNMKMLEVAVK